MAINKKSKIYVAGHSGMVGSAIVRRLMRDGFENFILRTHQELDLIDQKNVFDFFKNNNSNLSDAPVHCMDRDEVLPSWRKYLPMSILST